MHSSFDVIVVGQGLAGTALAWCLRWSDSRVLVIDREAPVTSSRVAAGLITPITGQRLVKTWRLAELWPAAVAFYRRVEAETGTACFRQTPMVRLFSNDGERTFFDQRVAAGEFDGLVRRPQPLVNESCFASELGGFEITDAGQLDVTQYLPASRGHFAREAGYRVVDLDLERDLELNADGVTLSRLGLTARRLVFCQGIDATTNPWFRNVPFKPAKGEILTLRIPGLTESHVIHRGVWLAPLGGNLYRAGSTYEWQELDCVPTARGRDEIVSRLREYLRLPFEVVRHEAAVRPIHRNQYPVVGLHPDHPQLGYFNGLGSKGALHAPFVAQHFAKVLASEEAIDPEVDLNRRTDLHGCRP